MSFNLAYVRGLSWVSDHDEKAKIQHLSEKGVYLQIYRESFQRHLDPLVVYDRKAFKEAAGIPLDPSDDNPSNTWIEYRPALKMMVTPAPPDATQLDLF